jgi:subtilisin family serine protease
MMQRWWIGVVVAISAVLVPYVGMVQQPELLQPMIVVFHHDVAFGQYRQAFRADERMQANPGAWGYLDHGVAGAVQALEARLGFHAEHVYSAALRGFSARLSAPQIASLQNNPIGADQSSTLAGDGMGAVANVRIYIIDSGVQATHPDLNVVPQGNFPLLRLLLNVDCNGHGTHVAGIAAAIDNGEAVVGVAPGAPLTTVKVLDCAGVGGASRIIKGVDWVTANAQKPAVANLSLGGGIVQALDDAVLNSVASGIFYAIAAGNDNDDACNYSPARAGTSDGAMTVAATDMSDQEPDFSNFGNCVDIWAPGVDIPSTFIGGGTQLSSGTSMASPHVAGAAALFLSLNPGATPADVENAIKLNAVNTGTFSEDRRPIMRLNVSNF